MRAFGVLPAGQNGFVSLSDVLSGSHQPHSIDQLDLYASLIEDEDVTEDEIDDHFKSLQFGPGETIEREYKPREDVTVFRDTYGVPHIYGETDEAAFFAAGYVAAEDRLWEMDLFRHAAKGQLSSLLGPGDNDSFLRNDQNTRRDGYTDKELDAMLDGLSDAFGQDGQRIEDGVAAYVEGVNTRIAEVKADSTLVPAEYQGAEITEWVPRDVSALAVFQLRDFGDTGGAELFHAGLVDQLKKAQATVAATFSSSLGKRAHNPVSGGSGGGGGGSGDRLGAALDSFRDFIIPSDPNTYTTIPAAEGAFPSQAPGKLDRDALALPDDPKKLISQVYLERRDAAAVQRVLGFRPDHQSNFLAVSPELSSNGHTLEFGAPQVGYTLPQFFLEMDVHSPNLDFRGPAVPGASLLVPLGRGIDYAWSLTTGASDNVDTWMEKLCKPGGGKPALDSDHYMHDGRCIAMEERSETIMVKNAIGQLEEHPMTVQRTVHGPIRARAKVNGKPVAVAQQKAFWMHEADSIVAFSRMNLNSTSSAEDFISTMEDASMSFNSVFANNDGIAYIHAGRYPLRAKGVDGNLPVWGVGKWDWKGYVAPSSLPRVVHPAQGWIANWNNKPSRGWRGGDASGWGPTHRSWLLQAGMSQLFDGGGKASLSDIVDVIRTAATIDGIGARLGRKMMSALGSQSGTASDAADAVTVWLDNGSHRIDLDDDGLQDYGPGVAIFDAWYDALAKRIFNDELSGNYFLVSVPIADRASSGGSSYYSDYSNYIWNLMDRNARDKLAMNYCDNIKTEKSESCNSQVRKAFGEALASLQESTGSGDVSTWTKPIEKLHFSAIGGSEVPDIDWQNRGTWNHAVEVLGSR
jgi:acyl-homoserine lactone acylase PvdQ